MTVLSGLLSMGIFFFFLPWQMLRSEISSSLDASLGGWLSDKRTGRRGSGRIGQQSYMWKCDRISSACYGGIPVGWRRTEAHNPRRGSSHFLLEVPLAVWNTTNKLKLANALGKPSFWWPNSETWVGKWTAATNNSNSEETSWDQYKVQDCKLSLMLLQRKIFWFFSFTSKLDPDHISVPISMKITHSTCNFITLRASSPNVLLTPFHQVIKGSMLKGVEK